MTAFVPFEARIDTVRWGDTTHTLIRLPPEVVAALGPTRRVEGEVADHPVNLAIIRAPVVDGPFLWAGASLLNRIKVAAGDLVEVRLRPAPDDRVDLAPDIAAALIRHDCTDRWDALSPGKRRGVLYQIDTARTEATRAKRIARLIADLSAPRAD